METPAQREERIAELDARRAQRRSQGVGQANVGATWPTPDQVGMGYVPVEIGPGRGDLNYSSAYWPVLPTSLNLLGGYTVSFTRLFQSQPWVAAAVMRLLTWAIRVPLRAYRHTDDPNDREPLTGDEHPIAGMLERPWDRASTTNLTMSLLGPMLVHGNSVTRMDDTANSGTIEMDPKDWRFCQPIMSWRDSLDGFRFDTDSEFMDSVPIDKVLHCAYWSPTGPGKEPLGTSPLQQLGVTLQIEDAAQRYQRAVFQQGGRPPSAVTASDAFLGIEPEERKEVMAQLRRDLTDLYGGPENMSKPALLPPGLDWKPLGGSVVEAALIDQRKITRDEVCAVYMIPPPMLGILDHATYSNIEVQRDMIYTQALGPPLILIEACVNAQIVRDLFGMDDVYVEYDFSRVLRGDRIQEINALRAGIMSGLFSPNEGRGYLGLPRADATLMDDYWMPTNNLSPISSLAPGDLAPKQKGPLSQPPASNGNGNGSSAHSNGHRHVPKGGIIIVQEGREYVLGPAG